MERKEKGFNRAQAINIVALALTVIYLILCGLSLILNLFFFKIWFSFALFIIGFLLLIKAIFFHLDSDMLLGLLLCFGAIISGIFHFIDFSYPYIIYLSAAALAFFIVFIIFRQNFHLILVALLLLEVLLLGVENLLLASIFWSFQIFYFIVLIAVFLLITIKPKESKSAVSDK